MVEWSLRLPEGPPIRSQAAYRIPPTGAQTTPKASMASATFRNPATFAPRT